MCGIIGYIGYQPAVDILITGLKRLEYRGYDSSGVGLIDSKTKRFEIRKIEGKIKNLEKLIAAEPVSTSAVGISHTRWATHGPPNKKNSHPHGDSSGKILIVHNGIIENYEVLKEQLQKKGVKFLSDTDTEVVAHLIGQYYKDDILSAVKKAVNQLHGAFALGVLCTDHPEQLIAVRVGSPLIIGRGKGENFIASDVPAILERTRDIIYLDDRQIAVITKDSVDVMGFDGKRAAVKVKRVDFALDAVQKQGYDHFMLKEIYEQPTVIEGMIRMRLKGNTVVLKEIGLSDAQLKSIQRVVIVACGTAYHAGMVGKYLIEALARVPVTVDVSSEFRYRNPIIDKKTLVVAVSQSGETADTLAAVREAKEKGAKVVAVCNVIGSSLVREADGVLYTHAGPEIGVASTKAYTAQLFMLYLLAIKFGALKNFPVKRLNQIVAQLKKIPAQHRAILAHKEKVAVIAKKNSHFGCFLFLGRNVDYPSALEGALKLKEISYIPAEGYAAGEMKHGPIALIDEYRAVVCIATQSDIYEKMISNIQEIRARQGKIIAIATEGDTHIKSHVSYVIHVPKTDPLLSPLLAVLPLQLLAYYVAVKRGCDVDQPRNLAKSVTVE